MREFGDRTVTRVVEIQPSDPAMPVAEWIVEVNAAGIYFRRKGAREWARALRWREVIGYGLATK